MTVLEVPALPSQVYLARGDEVPPHRPLFTGDVYELPSIPGVVDEPCLGMVLTHPCSIRADGVHLVDRVLVGLISEADPVAWKAAKRNLYLLEELDPQEPETFRQVHLDLVGMVPSTMLTTRLACLSPRGLNILQQRLIWYLTRYVAAIERINELIEPLAEEAELQEGWVELAVAKGRDPLQATKDFHDWIRAKTDGVSPQQRLLVPQDRSTVRREAKAAATDHYAD